MGVGVRYDSTRLLVLLVLGGVFYLLFLPTLWGAPKAGIRHRPEVTYGSDLPLQVKVTAWHPNFHVRRIRFTVNNVNSPALLDSRPLLPSNLLDREARKTWKVGFSRRLTFPRSETFDLSAPLGELARRGKLGTGIIRGTVDVEIDYTEVSMKADYPALSVLLHVPLEVRVTR